MYTVFAYHYVKPEARQAAEKQILEFGLTLRAFPGFIYRQTLVDESNPLVILTISTWRTKEDYQRWMDSPTCRAFIQRGGDHWSKPTERSFFNALTEL